MTGASSIKIIIFIIIIIIIIIINIVIIIAFIASYHLWQVVGRHVASDRMVSGAYKSEFGESDEITQCMKKVEVSYFTSFWSMFVTVLQHSILCPLGLPLDCWMILTSVTKTVPLMYKYIFVSSLVCFSKPRPSWNRRAVVPEYWWQKWVKMDTTEAPRWSLLVLLISDLTSILDHFSRSVIRILKELCHGSPVHFV